jgi:N6-L-threonylcarbamoyladenine synthase
MHILGIESSCDETAAAVVTGEGYVLSDVVQSQAELHARYGGVVPELASRDHLTNIPFVLAQAIERAGIGVTELDAIAVTNRPGLGGALLVGVQVAKGLALATGLPIIGVDHLVGHLFSPFLRRANRSVTELKYPFVALLASGGHTALYRVDGPHIAAIRELASTRDDAAGEAFDKGAKLLGLGYPGGPLIDALSKLGSVDQSPFSVAMPRSLEFSFSGLKTQLATELERHGLPTDGELANLASSYQRSIVSALTTKLFRAAAQENVNRVVIGGGVAANSELRATVVAMAQARGIEAVVPDLANCTDNAAMIAFVGALKFQRAELDNLGLTASNQSSLPRATRKGGGPRSAC